jgi:activating signal cointegrator 1
MEVKILSLWQPWATLIALGIKRFETRSWYTTYRGNVAIHAAKHKMTHVEYLVWLSALELAEENFEGFRHRRDIPLFDNLPLGCVVAISDLHDCFQMISGYEPAINPIEIDSVSELERALGDWRRGRYALEFDKVCPIEPYPYRGAKGLQNIPSEEIEKLCVQKELVLPVLTQAQKSQRC